MKIAVVAVTKQGAALARRLADSLRAYGRDTTEYAQAGKTFDDRQTSYTSVMLLVKELFHVVDGLVFVAATGIVVRAIAPHLRHKGVDPAVVVVDDQGNFAISLLAGHLGGANDLTRLLAANNGLQAVITTSTDGLQLVAPDLLAARWHLKVEPQTAILPVNAALAAGQAVPVWVAPDLPQAKQWCEKLSTIAGFGVGLTDVIPETGPSVIVSDKLLPAIDGRLVLRPPTLVAGIGCRRGMSESELSTALEGVLHDCGFSLLSVCRIASAWVKADEPGLQALAASLKVPFICYERPTLAETIARFSLTESGFVKQEIGVGNVCEAAVLSGPEPVQLITRKTRCNKITVAIARGHFMSWGSDPAALKI